MNFKLIVFLKKGSLYLIYLFVFNSFLGCAIPITQSKSNIQQLPKLSKKGISMDDGYWLPFREHKAIKNPHVIVVALHGFNDYSKAFDSMCDYLFSHEIQCIAYDQRGFGDTNQRGIWPGKNRLEQDLRLLIGEVKMAYPGSSIYLLGESMGGAVILSALSQNKTFWLKSIKGSILLAPAVWARELQPWYQRWALSLASYMVPGWKLSAKGLKIVPTDNKQANMDMARDKKVIKKTRVDSIWGLTNLMDLALIKAQELPVPSLILYGKKDEVIPKLATCSMLNKINKTNKQKKIQLALYENGYHLLTRDLQAKQVFEDIVYWMNTNNLKKSYELNTFCEKG